jgi:hypothetical protein
MNRLQQPERRAAPSAPTGPISPVFSVSSGHDDIPPGQKPLRFGRSYPTARPLTRNFGQGLWDTVPIAAAETPIDAPETSIRKSLFDAFQRAQPQSQPQPQPQSQPQPQVQAASTAPAPQPASPALLSFASASDAADIVQRRNDTKTQFLESQAIKTSEAHVASLKKQLDALKTQLTDLQRKKREDVDQVTRTAQQETARLREENARAQADLQRQLEAQKEKMEAETVDYTRQLEAQSSEQAAQAARHTQQLLALQTQLEAQNAEHAQRVRTQAEDFTRLRDAKHARQFDELKTNFEKRLNDQTSAQTGELARQLEAQRTAHTRQLEAQRTDYAAQLEAQKIQAAELLQELETQSTRQIDELRTAQERELARQLLAQRTSTDAQIREIQTQTRETIRQKEIEAAQYKQDLNRQLESQKTQFAIELETQRTEYKRQQELQAAQAKATTDAQTAAHETAMREMQEQLSASAQAAINDIQTEAARKLQDEIKVLTEQFTKELQDSKAQLDAQNATLGTLNDELQTELQKATDTATANELKISFYSGFYKQTKQEKKELQAEVVSLQETVRKQIQDISALNITIFSLQANTLEQDATNTRLTETLRKVQSEKDKEMREAETRANIIDDLSTQLKRSNATIAALRDKNAALQTNLIETKAAFNELEEIVKEIDLDSEKESLRIENQKLKQSLREKLDIVESLQQKLDIVESLQQSDMLPMPATQASVPTFDKFAPSLFSQTQAAKNREQIDKAYLDRFAFVIKQQVRVEMETKMREKFEEAVAIIQTESDRALTVEKEMLEARFAEELRQAEVRFEENLTRVLADKERETRASEEALRGEIQAAADATIETIRQEAERRINAAQNKAAIRVEYVQTKIQAVADAAIVAAEANAQANARKTIAAREADVQAAADARIAAREADVQAAADAAIAAAETAAEENAQRTIVTAEAKIRADTNATIAAEKTKARAEAQQAIAAAEAKARAETQQAIAAAEAKARAETQTAIAEKDAVQQQLLQIQTELGAVSSDQRALKTELAALKSTLMLQELTNTEVKKQLNAARAEAARSIAANQPIAAENFKMKTDLARLQATLKETQKVNETLQTENVALSSRLTRRKEKYRQIKNTNAQLGTELDASQAEAIAVKAQNVGLQREISTIRSETDAQISAVQAKADAQISAVNLEKTALQERVSVSEAKLQQVVEVVLPAVQELQAGAEEQGKEMVEALTVFTEAIDGLKTHNTELIAENEQLYAALNTEKENHNFTRGMLQEKEETIESLRHLLATSSHDEESSTVKEDRASDESSVMDAFVQGINLSSLPDTIRRIRSGEGAAAGAAARAGGGAGGFSRVGSENPDSIAKPTFTPSRTKQSDQHEKRRRVTNTLVGHANQQFHTIIGSLHVRATRSQMLKKQLAAIDAGLQRGNRLKPQATGGRFYDRMQLYM